MLIGRNPDCDVVLQKSRKVSRNHCLVACVGNRILVRDLGSTNGVWVNGQRVERESRVRLGDELSVADVKYHLVNVDAHDGNGQHGEKKNSGAAGPQPVVLTSQPVALPDEDDSFVVEASSPRLPRVRPEQIAAAEGSSARSLSDSSCDVIPLDEAALNDSDALIPLADAPGAGLGNEPDQNVQAGEIHEVTADQNQIPGDDDEGESEEVFSILDSVDESDDIIPLAPIDDE